MNRGSLSRSYAPAFSSSNQLSAPSLPMRLGGGPEISDISNILRKDIMSTVKQKFNKRKGEFMDKLESKLGGVIKKGKSDMLEGIIDKVEDFGEDVLAAL